MSIVSNIFKRKSIISNIFSNLELNLHILFLSEENADVFLNSTLGELFNVLVTVQRH